MLELGGRERILVIRHGWLKGMIFSTGAWEAISRYHENAHIVLITTEDYKIFGEQSGYFDEIWIDPMADWWDFSIFLKFAKKIREYGFDRIYDLQNSFRSNMYFRLLGLKKPEWSGTIDWCSHPYKISRYNALHPVVLLSEQLRAAGVDRVPMPDISWLSADISRIGLDGPFAIIAPGSNRQENEKLWYDEGYMEVIEWLNENGILPVFVGAKEDQSRVSFIVERCKNETDALDLTGKLMIDEVAELARYALFALGNDSGVMHLVAATDCHSILLFSALSDPALCKPAGKYVNIIRQDDLEDLHHGKVIDELDRILMLDSSEKLPKSAEDEELE